MLYSIDNEDDLKLLYSNLIEEFVRHNRSITYDDVFFSQELEVETSKVIEILNKDKRFIKLGNEKNYAGLQYLQKNLLVKKLLELNFKISNNKIKYIKIVDFFYFINPILTGEIDAEGRSILLYWGQKYSLVFKNKNNILFFPYSDIYNNLKNNYFHNLSERFLSLIDYLNQPSKTIKKIKNEFFKDFLNSYIPKDKYRKIFESKFGFNDGEKKTLDKTGIKFRITRERVRQIISKSEKNISICNKNTSEKLLKFFIINLFESKGSKMIQDSNNIATHRINFTNKYFGIPFYLIKELNCYLLGVDEDKKNFIKNFIKNNILVEKKYIEISFNEIIDITLNDKDYKKIIDIIRNYTINHLYGVEIAYCGLKKIGKPAHYSEVTDVCNKLFAPRIFTTREIHSYLTRNDLSGDLPFVWVGMKGIYALKEWGYEKPETDLFELIADIVLENYIVTKRPISLNKIISEVLKVRKMCNENSIIIASGINDRVIQIGKNQFIPISEYNKNINNQIEIKESTDLKNLDDALSKFDR